jgi:hypothetical protein
MGFEDEIWMKMAQDRVHRIKRLTSQGETKEIK